MRSNTKDAIVDVLEDCIKRAIQRVKIEKTYRPFHDALLTKGLVFASAFERSFSTSFGQGPIENISKIIVSATGAECVLQKETRVNVNKGAIDEIERILSSLRSNESRPNWHNENERIAALKKGDYVQRRVVSDLWFKRNNVENYFSIKTVKPNLDQTEIVKKDLLLLKAHNPNFNTFFALYYNPGGPNREDYNWSIPARIFDMKNDECVLIGKDYWDLIGGTGTYDELLDIFEQVGKDTQKALNEVSNLWR